MADTKERGESERPASHAMSNESLGFIRAIVPIRGARAGLRRQEPIREPASARRGLLEVVILGTGGRQRKRGTCK